MHGDRNQCSLDQIVSYTLYCINKNLEDVLANVRGLVIDMEDSGPILPQWHLGFWAWRAYWENMFQIMMKKFPNLAMIICVPDGEKRRTVLRAEELSPIDLQSGKGLEWRRLVKIQSSKKVEKQQRIMQLLSSAFQQAKGNPKGDFYLPEMRERKIEFQTWGVRKISSKSRKNKKQKNREVQAKRIWFSWLPSKMRRDGRQKTPDHSSIHL